ncbi:pilus assembly protein [Rhodobacteraceae bacterium B1Z28]|uniref:Pilus assembly protein n=1 Tax=Ruegeria haliotis TaxID=2747601 RepID=A0ABX2PL11_9RHOB|nr:TadE/TadG family type IV pilus assembly protein [Ruegeria haliotis]NVO54774.1 pilus assembly protein [Ruegeria haliotis]
MIKRLISKARRFRRDESGTSTIEFVMWFPIFVMTAYSGLEIGIVSFNHANLERAVDEIVQDVRMNNIHKYTTSQDGWTEALLKREICERAGSIPKCFEKILLEMESINPLDAPGPDSIINIEPLCVDSPKDIRDKDKQIFTVGNQNELMVIRACVEVKPLFLGTTLGQLARFESNGHYELHSMSVFVHEPN